MGPTVRRFQRSIVAGIIDIIDNGLHRHHSVRSLPLDLLMSIATRCPHCDKAYNLRDELAVKRVHCSNPNCKKAFSVPSKSAAPVAAPKAAAEATPAAKPVNVEEMALAAFAGEE